MSNNLKLIFRTILRKIMREDQESVKGKLIYGIFWNLISALASQGFPMIAAIVTARLLGKSVYGQLGMVNSTVILFSTFAGLGLGITATKYIAQFRQTDPERTGRIMGLTNLFGIASGVVMCIILFIMAPWLASNTLSAPDLTLALQIASLLLIFNTVIGIQSGSIAGFGAFKDLAHISIFQGIISSSLIVIGVYFYGLFGAITAMVLNSIINLILYKLTINSLVKEFGIKISYLSSWSEKNIIWETSFPSMLSNIMVGPVVWVVNVIIINTNGGYGQLGLFNAADQWRSAVAFLPGVIGNVLLPLVTEYNEKNETLEKFNVIISWIIVILIALPLISFPEIISFLYGTDYYSTNFIQVLALMLFVSCITAYRDGISRKLIVKNLMWWGFLDNILWAIFLVGSVILLKNLGALGLSISYIIAYTLNTVIFVPFYLWKNVVPHDVIISKSIFLIWAVLIFQTIITLLNVLIILRILFFIISIFILILLLNSKLKLSRLIENNVLKKY